jgi:hypothetical protein
MEVMAFDGDTTEKFKYMIQNNSISGMLSPALQP